MRRGKVQRFHFVVYSNGCGAGFTFYISTNHQYQTKLANGMGK